MQRGKNWIESRNTQSRVLGIHSSGNTRCRQRREHLKTGAKRQIRSNEMWYQAAAAVEGAVNELYWRWCCQGTALHCRSDWLNVNYNAGDHGYVKMQNAVQEKVKIWRRYCYRRQQLCQSITEVEGPGIINTQMNNVGNHIHRSNSCPCWRRAITFSVTWPKVTKLQSFETKSL